MTMSSLVRPALRAQALSPNVFAAFSALALKHGSVNLGQGFPTFPAPDFLKDAVCEAIHANNNQYGRPGGHPELVGVIGTQYSEQLARKIDGMTNVCTYSGAQEGIAAAAMAFVNPGDEVVVIEPYFDAYVNAVKLAGGKVIGVPLRTPEGATVTNSSDYTLDPAELDRAITPNTKMLILNTPHNPTGKVFSKSELVEVSDVVARHPDLIVLSDEVYEHSVYDDTEHIAFATINDMWKRTISLYSVGKTFSVTGFRLGYSIAPEELSRELLKIRAALSFSSVTPIEIGTAKAIAACRSNNYYQDFRTMMQAKRDVLVAAMTQAGIPPVVPQGGYFTVGDTSGPLVGAVPRLSEDDTAEQALLERRDFRVARWLTTEANITGIPMSCFYEPHNRYLANDVIRFCHAKDDDTMLAARSNFQKFAKQLS
ncbi:hypothetical protein SARC_04811 [Sphaeroforma arctica JP610]|uniref:Aminotransferase class I/classII large domain-containing protein n=1 Tax=Sphaeroforma arctica JP610 TaxID=667725 RepID=A0A0L0G3X1_9EUKA|nr:hypothetical protein SARC_04811 [Sphaeroforma arctica JP610]KNC82918.1 hypothetical protein SARC_04811 [Sphaeroforma arctica JP610]|eukprot:XP_014156820.1 hypothetical protein SARC_04811 [Sphaeroforma arctica JP610]